MNKLSVFLCLFCSLSPLFSWSKEVDCFDDPDLYSEEVQLSGFNHATNFDLGEYRAFLTKGLFFWQAQQENMSPGLIRSTSSSALNSETIELKQSYEPGFSIAGGYRTHHGDWQIQLGCTYFRSHVRSPNTSLSADSGKEVVPFWAHANHGLGAFLSEESNWKLHNYIFDGFLYRRYYVGELLLFSTQIGLRSYLCNQKFLVKYAGPSTTLESYNAADSWNFGPRWAASSSWFLGSGLRLIGKTGASLAYAKYTLSHNEKNSTNTTIFKIKDDRYRLASAAELSAGIGWGASFFQQTFHLDLELSYDLLALFGQNMMQPLIAPFAVSFEKSSQTLYLQGFTFIMRSDF